jgi:ADP-ribosyl-[dinitrogen reductase] hydrolase
VQSFAPQLDLAIKAARVAGDLLRADFHRPTGPRGEGDKAPADTEAEQLVRDLLLAAHRDWGFLGEETGSVPGAPGAPVWVVDPNDGTRDYIKGRRGSAVSIALVFERRPVLGVVHVFGYPDDRGRVYSAVQGREGVWRDGAPVHVAFPEQLSELDVVLVSGGGDRAARANLLCTKPARVMSIPSIAHRLARVAAGEAAATTSLYSPKTWDFAAGHCLIRAAGGALVDENGREPVYDDAAFGTAPRLFAGSRPVALELSTRNWDVAFGSERGTDVPIVRLARGRAVADSDLLSRAQGALLGLFVGSSLGKLFGGTDRDAEPRLDAASVQSAGIRRRLAPGQLGSTGEVAVATARSLVNLAGDAEALRVAYRAWVDSAPPDPDRAMESAMRGQALSEDGSPLCLARVTPLTLWTHDAEEMIAAAKAEEDAALTHPSVRARQSAAVLSVTIRALLRGSDPRSAVDAAHAFARKSTYLREVIDAVVESASLHTHERTDDALGVLRATLFSLRTSESFEAALESALSGRRDPRSDALPAIVGTVMGARLGRDGIPARLATLVLSARPMEGLVAQPRPPLYWATDAMAMAEALLTAR